MKKVSFVLNSLIAAATVVALIVMFFFPVEGPLSVKGVENFKFYTVQSNVFCGVVAVIYLFMSRKKEKMPRGLILVKMMTAAAVLLTFLMVIFFLGPMFGHKIMYKGYNLEFHLIIPLLAVIEFIVLDMGRKIPFRYTVISVVPTVIYGICYALNLLINGVGVWPKTNDFYGFVTWGFPVGFAIFGVAVLIVFVLSCLLRLLNHKVHSNYPSV